MNIFQRLTMDPYQKSPRVIDTTGVELRVEHGDLSEYRGDRLAVVSSWTPTPVMSRSLSRYLEELDWAGYRSLVVNTTVCDGPLQWPHGLPLSATVVRRENVGYDFGSWAAALDQAPQIREAKHAVLTNDSMVGPFASLAYMIQMAERSEADVFGLTESYQIIRHPQSFFLMFREGVLQERPFRDFFDNVRPQDEKVAVIQAYELGLSRHCAREGYSWESLVTSYQTRSGRENPTLHGWRSILNANVPFIKRNLLLEPERPDTSAQMAAEIAFRFGEDVRDWLPPGYQLPQDSEKTEKRS